MKKLYSLDDVIGQTNIVNWFKSCIKRDRLPQVIMLQGPAGIGKTSIAKIVACEIACKNNPDKLDVIKQAVINENKETDCVKCYNMSNLKSQEAVLQVKSDLTVGFSSTGRKVIIMDEAHGMSDDAQDSLLVQFEALPIDVYIIVCTTEVTSFRDAFLSRCVLRRLTNLNKTEMRNFISQRIKDRNLTFELSLPVVYSLISSYTGREPRRAINLIDSFDESTVVSVDDLNSFFNVYEGKELVTLVDYLYSNNVLYGLEFIDDMSISSTFTSTLLEILRVAEGGESTILTRDTVLHVRELTGSYGIEHLLGFCIDCTTHSKLTRSMISGYFLKHCNRPEIYAQPAQPYQQTKIQNEDLSIMRDMIEVDSREHKSTSDNVKGMSLEDMFAAADTLIPN